jgi:hypothetical protein
LPFFPPFVRCSNIWVVVQIYISPHYSLSPSLYGRKFCIYSGDKFEPFAVNIVYHLIR